MTLPLVPLPARWLCALATSDMGRTWSTISLTLLSAIIGNRSAIAAVWSRLPAGDRPMLKPITVRLDEVMSEAGKDADAPDALP